MAAASAVKPMACLLVALCCMGLVESVLGMDLHGVAELSAEHRHIMEEAVRELVLSKQEREMLATARSQDAALATIRQVVPMDVPKALGCADGKCEAQGCSCNILGDDPCCPGYLCLPVGIVVGVCV